VHGDFRTGNFMVTPRGLTGVLDWEFARFGAPEEDIAWIGLRPWRFGQRGVPIGGFARREEFYAAYEAASKRRVVPRHVHWWEVIGNVRWAIGCIQQGERYLAGEHDIELIAIPHHAIEMEYEALRLIQQGAPASKEH
jgi:aminoglycoside phosphotransferase (APT) family kinase protein